MGLVREGWEPQLKQGQCGPGITFAAVLTKFHTRLPEIQKAAVLDHLSARLSAAGLAVWVGSPNSLLLTAEISIPGIHFVPSIGLRLRILNQLDRYSQRCTSQYYD